MFLYGDVGEMHKHVVQLTDTGTVLDRAEPAESQSVPAGKFCNMEYVLVTLLACVIFCYSQQCIILWCVYIHVTR